MKGRVALAHRFDRAIGHLLHRPEPWLGEHRLDDRVASRAHAYRMLMRLDLFEQAALFEVLDDLLARILARQSAICARVFIHPRLAVEHRDLLEAVTLAQFEVDRVVGGSYFQGAGAEFAIDRGVGDDLYLAPH